MNTKEHDLWEREVSLDFHETMNQIRMEPAPQDCIDRLLMSATSMDEAASSTTGSKSGSNGSQELQLASKRNKLTTNRTYSSTRTVLIALKTLAASLLIIGGIVWIGNGNGTLSSVAFAGAIPGVDDVAMMTWTKTYFPRASTKDGKLIGVGRSRKLMAYRHPGQYRETQLDEDGSVVRIRITDYRVNRVLVLDVKGKKAVLKAPSHPDFLQSPFAFVGDVIRDRKSGSDSLQVKSVSLQGKKEFENKQVNVVQAIIRSLTSESQTRHDYLFDENSKQLVGVWTSNELDFDYESAVELKDWKIPDARVTMVGGLSHEIDLQPSLSLSEFSLDAPAGYELEKMAAPTVTEDEMVAYLKAAARFNDNKLPDSPFSAYDRDKLSAALNQDESLQSAEAKELMELVQKFKLREIYTSPIRRFVDDQTLPDSFHYLGSGVALGDANRIVCWYTARSANANRAIYADLSVRNIAVSDLPLSLSK